MIVTVDEMKEYLRIQQDDEDELLERLLRQAQAAAEDMCGVSFDGDNPPESAKLAITLMVSHFYENRDSSDKNAYATMRAAFDALLWPCRDPAKLF